MQKHSLEIQFEQALDKLQQHSLKTDADILGELNTQLADNRTESQRAWGGAAVLALVLFLGLGAAVWYRSAWGVFVIIFLMVLMVMTTVGHRINKAAREKLKKAIEAIQREDYQDSHLTQALKQWRGDLSPLTGDRNLYAESLSEKAGKHPVIGPIWAGWLLSEAPIRESDLNPLRDALEADQAWREWQEEKDRGIDGLNQFRARMLERLPVEVTNQARAARLDTILPESTASPVVRKRF